MTSRKVAIPTREESALRLVFSDRFYRSATIALFLYGIAVSATLPQMTLFLTRELGASLSVAGSYFLTYLVAPLAGVAIGALSDRRRDRLLIFRVCVGLAGAGWLAIGLSTQLWMPFVIGAVVLSLTGSIMAQLLAAVRDQLSRRPTTAENRILAMVRMGFSGGWVVGPVLGTWVGSAFGPRTLIMLTAVLTWAQLIPIGRQKILRYIPVPTSEAKPAQRISIAPLLIFTGLAVFAMSGDTIKFAYLPIFMTEQLHSSALALGLVIAVQPLLEVALMPVAARLADRYDALIVLVVGAAFGVAAAVTFATGSTATAMFAGQILNAIMWACLAGLGVSIAQQLYPIAVATASGLFTGAIMLAFAVGGAVGGLGVTMLGVPGVFYIPSVFTAVAVVGLSLLWRRPAVRAALSTPAVGPTTIAGAGCGDH